MSRLVELQATAFKEFIERYPTITAIMSDDRGYFYGQLKGANGLVYTEINPLQSCRKVVVGTTTGLGIFVAARDT